MTKQDAVSANPLFGMALMALAFLYLPIMDGTAKYLAQSLPVGQIVFARFTLQCCFLLPFMWWLGLPLWPRENAVLQMMRGIVMMLTTLLFFSALLHMPLADAISITFIQPMIVTILSVLWLGEVIRWRRILSIMLGFSGAMLIIQPHFITVGWAALLPFGAAVAFALYIILTKKLAADVHPVQMQFSVGATSVVVIMFCWLCFPNMLGGVFAFQPIAASQAGLLLIIGIVATSGHLLIVSAMRFAPANLLAPIQYTEILGATLLGLLLFGDVPTQSTMIGIALIVGAGLFLFYREHKAANQTNHQTEEMI